MVTSPNYPCNYPNNLNQAETIIAKEGMVVDLEFTVFKTESEHDKLEIQDNDGTILLPARGGSNLPPPIRSRTNVVLLQFVTDRYSTRTEDQGWSATWTSAKSIGEILREFS